MRWGLPQVQATPSMQMLSPGSFNSLGVLHRLAEAPCSWAEQGPIDSLEKIVYPSDLSTSLATAA